LSAFSSSKANNINHVTFALDASHSMSRLASDLVKVADSQIQFLAERSKFHDQETRITVYTFTHPGYGTADIKCLIYDKDVLRMPSIAGLYHTDGWTPLCDAITLAVADMKLIPQKYGDHSFLLYVLTDGLENKSKIDNVYGLSRLLADLDTTANWTLAGFVPSPIARNELQKYGFAKGNIQVWDPTETGSLEEVNQTMRVSTDRFMADRTKGVRATKSLFHMAAPAVADVIKALTPMTTGSYYFEQVTEEDTDSANSYRVRIDQFMQGKLGKPYIPDGNCFYQMTKRERIQPHKRIAVAVPSHKDQSVMVYVGKNARKMLDLPPEEAGTEVRVSPGRWKDYKVFISTTSMNRYLHANTSLLVMR
jgi:hypothetical protein